MGKYIPKVGETFEWRESPCKAWQTCGAVLARTEKAIACPSGTGFINTFNTEHCEFRPIPTKADAEREQLEEMIKHCEVSSVFTLIERIQKAGFTIPKKVKRSDIEGILDIYSSIAQRSIITTLADRLCKLLGDLVEQAND